MIEKESFYTFTASEPRKDHDFEKRKNQRKTIADKEDEKT